MRRENTDLVANWLAYRLAHRDRRRTHRKYALISEPGVVTMEQV